MKASELKDDVTYIICPEKSCRLFEVRGPERSCDGKCPFQEKQKLVVGCDCGGMVVLPGGHKSWYRVDHPHPEGGVGSTFARMSGKYFLLYKLPSK